MPPGPPILIALPSGLVTSGVVAWAVRLVNAFANQGRLAGLILHTPSKGHAPLDIALHYNVRVHDLSDLPPLDTVNGDLTPFIPRYRDALHDLALASGHPVALLPNLLGDCYGIGAAISMVEPEILRILAWAHSDIPYDVAVQKHYEPAIARFVPCSRTLTERLTAAIPTRANHIVHIPHGVTIPAAHSDSPTREPYQGQRPLRLIYTGRIEQDPKRVPALLCLSDELARRGVAHELTLLGDGPATAEIDRACASRRSVTRLPPVSSERVHAILSQQDIFVLASRIEGLSIALLEALACGCVPVITRTRSGSAEAITDGVDGRLIDWEGPLAAVSGDTHAQHARLGELLADGVCDAVSRNLARLSQNAIAKAKANFTHEAHVARAMALVDEVAAEAPRAWPAHRPSAFTSPIATSSGVSGTTGTVISASSGTVPAHAAERLRQTLTSLAGRRIIIHGTGRHTQELAHVLADYITPTTAPNANAPTIGPTIVAFTDDDPTRHGSSILGLPVIAPHDAHAMAADVIISSYINQNDIWQRRNIYEAKGLAVHRLYPEAA